jgi:hypothetical protein
VSTYRHYHSNVNDRHQDEHPTELRLRRREKRVTLYQHIDIAPTVCTDRLETNTPTELRLRRREKRVTLYQHIDIAPTVCTDRLETNTPTELRLRRREKRVALYQHIVLTMFHGTLNSQTTWKQQVEALDTQYKKHRKQTRNQAKQQRYSNDASTTDTALAAKLKPPQLLTLVHISSIDYH